MATFRRFLSEGDPGRAGSFHPFKTALAAPRVRRHSSFPSCWISGLFRRVYGSARHRARGEAGDSPACHYFGTEPK
jgi:hypothetical protein